MGRGRFHTGHHNITKIAVEKEESVVLKLVEKDPDRLPRRKLSIRSRTDQILSGPCCGCGGGCELVYPFFGTAASTVEDLSDKSFSSSKILLWVPCSYSVDIWNL
jgi:hypothetical protein